MPTLSFDKLKHVSGKSTSPDRSLFLDLINNPQNYKGYIVYITEVDQDELYDPFYDPGRFYFNEGGVWQSSDFFPI